MSTAPRRVPLDAILRRSARAKSRPLVWRNGPVDRSKWFVCPTLTPLYYAPIYRDLGEGHQRRYNQLTGLCFNELIAFFEESFAGSVLAALADARRSVDGLLAECLESFLQEERRHIGYWRELNRRSEPDLYRDRMNAVLEFPAPMRRLLRLLTDHPTRFPVVFWVMLALEERSLDISRRCLRLDPAAIESRYRNVYRHHLRDEARHVQLDRYLIERFYEPLPIRWRRLNARLLATLIGRFFLPSTRSAVRVVCRLTTEHPELAPLLPEMIRQLGRIGDDPDYQDMMYSRATTPITFSLFDRFEELHGMSRVLMSYRPDFTAVRDRWNA